MVPETHEIEFLTSEELRKFLTSEEFYNDTVQKLRDQYVVEVDVKEPRQEKQSGQDITIEKMVLSYTRNNAGGLKDAIDFLLLPLISRGLDSTTVKGAIPRPKSDSFEDNMPYFDSRLLQRAEPAVSTESPTRGSFPADDPSSRSIFDKLRKPGSMSSFSSFIERRRKNGSNSPGSLFMHASSNASKASLVSMESRDSGYRNPWNDSGIDLEHDQPNGNGNGNGSVSHNRTANGWGSFGASSATSRPNTSSNSLSGAFETKFPFGSNGNASTSSLNTPMIPGLGMVNGNGGGGDVTPKYDASARSADGVLAKGSHPLNGSTSSTEAAKPDEPLRLASSTSTSNANTNASASSGYPAPIGPPR